jgi:hypothetical protein
LESPGEALVVHRATLRPDGHDGAGGFVDGPVPVVELAVAGSGQVSVPRDLHEGAG